MLCNYGMSSFYISTVWAGLTQLHCNKKNTHINNMIVYDKWNCGLKIGMDSSMHLGIFTRMKSHLSVQKKNWIAVYFHTSENKNVIHRCLHFRHEPNIHTRIHKISTTSSSYTHWNGSIISLWLTYLLRKGDVFPRKPVPQRIQCLCASYYYMLIPGYLFISMACNNEMYNFHKFMHSIHSIDLLLTQSEVNFGAFH